MGTKLDKMVIYLDGLLLNGPPFASSCETTKLGRISTYLDGLLPINSHDLLIT